ncbi:carbonic anhydrase [Mytilinidion resinicola]|uniref:Carbonic anhydrase n=1 Tax=Mytilinidion resinicola TaxID=574789 RepID=A0A6A6YW09_9PEZI|nr:carbonic anhydrase [Mytilinidion resinicola]KAF2812087.1 carbonic anhydrase [Mytilinidion resinicola]
MASEKIASLLERNKGFNVALAPPFVADISKRLHTPGGPGGTVIISCSDPRVIPEQYFDFGRGVAAVIRNAGGRTSDALRSLAALDALGNTDTVIIVHHTDCGMTHMPDAGVRKMLKERAPQLSKEIDRMKFGEITDVDESIRQDIALLRASPLISKTVTIVGFNLDILTGQLTEVK